MSGKEVDMISLLVISIVVGIFLIAIGGFQLGGTVIVIGLGIAVPRLIAIAEWRQKNNIR
jgi:hypothetical protein